MWRQRKEGEALEEGEMVGIGQDVRLLVEEDSMAEVEVVADVEQEQLSSQEPEENPEEQSQERATQVPRMIYRPTLEGLESLAALQAVSLTLGM